MMSVVFYPSESNLIEGYGAGGSSVVGASNYKYQRAYPHAPSISTNLLEAKSSGVSSAEAAALATYITEHTGRVLMNNNGVVTPGIAAIGARELYDDGDAQMMRGMDDE